MYYVHSFYGTDCEESIIATSAYGVTITGAVRSGKVVMGLSFSRKRAVKPV